jgi:hypothetical protein
VRVLVCGWFSFFHGEATAGDLYSRDAVCGWLTAAGIAYDVAMSPVFGDHGDIGNGVDLEAADPLVYTHVVFVCGPLGGWQVEDLVERFRGRRLVAINVSLVGSPVERHFDTIIERDGRCHGSSRPDLTFTARLRAPRLPVIGVVRAPGQAEYAHSSHRRAHQAIDDLLGARLVTPIEVDTRVDPRLPGQRHSDQVEARLAVTDAVITTRLHGLVLALEKGTPAVAVDPVAGGAKVTAQARAVGWPALIPGDAVTVEALGAALDWCLTDEARRRAARCADQAAGAAAGVRRALLDAVDASLSGGGPAGRGSGGDLTR